MEDYLKRKRVLQLVSVLQLFLAWRVIWRLLRSAGGKPILPEEGKESAEESVAVLVPVLNERQRLAPCLDGLIAQGMEVAEIVVVDGGSEDGTQELVATYTRRDARVQLVDASPVPPDWNGKAWGLQVGLDSLRSNAPWVLTVDADVRPQGQLVNALLGRASSESLDALSVATLQEIDSPAEGLLHPALLTTLVYRFGIPGNIFRHVSEVQANGQCFLFRRDVLAAVGGFAPTRHSRCEDVTIARLLVKEGYCLGFYEAGPLVHVKMYTNWREMWLNWPRSLPMHDQFSGLSTLVGWLEVAFVQALPLPLLVFLLLARRRPSLSLLSLLINAMFVAIRLGVLFGTARTYEKRPWSYWFSPLCDPAVALWLAKMALQRRHVWRGRPLVRGTV
jgi:dolichol-phosphate mannosyltransferase